MEKFVLDLKTPNIKMSVLSKVIYDLCYNYHMLHLQPCKIYSIILFLL